MRHSLLRGALLCLLVAPVAAGCVVPPEPGSSAPPEAQVVQADARALAYGRTAGEILNNPQLRDKVRALFVKHADRHQRARTRDPAARAARSISVVGAPAGPSGV